MSAKKISILKSKIDGDLLIDNLHKIIYATDASVYRELPLGVVYPRHKKDVVEIVRFCHQHTIPLIPRAGGTSLAGQCVGSGLVMDVSKYMDKLISVDTKRKTATVQPGIIRDELNRQLKFYGLMVGPNTSTANRATLGGMVGNNSCGSTSIVFGNTRDHIEKMDCVLSDGTTHYFEEINRSEYNERLQEDSRVGEIYQFIDKQLSQAEVRNEIIENFPKSSIRRRNTGYAVDSLLESGFYEDNDCINICKLLCGSEGTLAVTTELTIGLVNIPPPYEVLVAVHYQTVDDSLVSVPAIMNHQPFACELMDKTILDCTKEQRAYQQDRFFLEGDPQAVMLVSFVGESIKEARQKTERLVADLKSMNYGYAYPILTERIDRVWNLRKAGLGLLANLPGDKKAVACIEDTAVAIDEMSAYIVEFTAIMNRFGQKSVYYAHAGAGELHLRPLLDLKNKGDRKLFYEISLETAKLVKKFRGSLSGEHGDGRVRAPFIQEMYGERVYKLFCELKEAFDPQNIFNPGKIVHAAPIIQDLRFDENHVERSYDTVFNFDEVGGVLRAAEKCNGSGDCRKTHLAGGTMCPSYMATKNEKSTTRARANTLREVLTRPQSENAWNSEELKEVLDLCLSCKGCTSECPSNVDMSTLKAEFLHHYQKHNGISFRSKLFANFGKMSSIGSKISGLTNLMLSGVGIGLLSKTIMGVHPKRDLPKIHRNTLRKRYSKLVDKKPENIKGTIFFFCDEFTNFNDPEIGEKAILLLQSLGYDVKIVDHPESGRAAFSKGLLDIAKEAADENVKIFSKLVSDKSPLIGVEPSTILSFRDEYPKIVNPLQRTAAEKLAPNCLTIEEFLYRETENGNISSDDFKDDPISILLHGHCHQKALTDIKQVAWVLGLPKNSNVEIIPSGCCGMAGSFGYEKEHYEVSMDVGELILFPAVRNANDSTIIAASGTSCRHQIYDGTRRKALHPVEVLFDVLKK